MPYNPRYLTVDRKEPSIPQRFSMTTPDTAAKQPKTGGRFVLPDPPERELD